MVAEAETIEKVSALAEKYKYGFVTDIETESAPKGLNEDIIRFISAKKDEPEWLLEWRLKAYRYWLDMPSPDWAKLNIPPIDYQDAFYYSAPKSVESRPETIDDVDPALIETYNKLGIPLHEQEMLAGVQQRSVAVDVVFDSVSVATTFRDKLADLYGDGAEWLFAVDLARILDKTTDESESAHLESLGLMDLQHVIAEIKEKNDRTENSVVLTFAPSLSRVASFSVSAVSATGHPFAHSL